MSKVYSIAPGNRSNSGLYHNISILARKTILALATLIPFEAAPTKVYAENKPEKEKIVRSYAEESWTILKDGIAKKNSSAPSYRWNNIIAALIVGDNTNIADLDNTRNEILSLAKENPEVPLEVLETTIYTAGVNAEAINKEITENNIKIKTLETDGKQSDTIEKIKHQNENLIKRKQKTLKLVIEYLASYPVDAIEKGIKTRKLTPVHKSSDSKTEKVKNFQNVVNYAIAQLCNNEDIAQLIESFLDIKERELAINFLDIFNYLNKNSTVTPLKKLVDKVKYELSNSYLSKGTKDSKSLSSITNTTKTYLAKSILFLSQIKDKDTDYFCKRWFELKPTNETPSEEDFIVLKALCITTENNIEKLKILEQIAAKFPKVFFDSYFHACQTNVDSPKRQAGQEIINILNKNPHWGNKLLRSLLDKNSPTSTDSSFTKALITISCLSSQEPYIATLQKVIASDNENEENKIIAMHGLTKARDKNSILTLFNIALNESSSQNMRTTALKAILLIDSPDRFYKEYLDNLLSKSPFNLDLSFFEDISKSKDTQNKEDKNYLFKIAPGSTEEDTIYSFVRSIDLQYGGNKGYLKELSLKKDFKQKYLIPFIDYLKECKDGKRIIDLKLAHLMIYILGKSNIHEASELLADIATYPELYIKKAPANQITNSEYTTTNTVFIKLVAISCLGDVVDLNKKDDKGAKVLHTLSRFDSSHTFYTISDVSLLMLAERYEKNPPSLIKEHQKQESIKNLIQYIENTRKEKIVSAWYTENNRPFILGLTIAKLGGTKELLKIVLDTSKENPISNVIRAIIQSLYINGLEISDIEKFEFNNKDTSKLKSIYKNIVEERFWLRDVRDSGLTGKGIQVAVIDGGHIISPKGFYPTFNRGITLPDGFIGLHNPGGMLSRHAYSVVAGIKNIAPDAEILSLTWDNLSPLKPSYRPTALASDNTVITLEHLIEGIIQGKYNPRIANCSFGIKGWLINTKEDGVVGNLPNPDLRSAMLELLANSGTLPLVSIGNDYGNYPGDYRNGEVAEWNAFGLRFLGNGKFIQPKNIIHVSAMDEYKGIIAPYNGVQDPLRANLSIESIGVHGTLILPSFYQHRGTLGNKPGSGTSFSNPRLAGLLSLFLEKADKQGISHSPHELRDKVFSTAKEIPDSKYFEVRKKLDSQNLLKSEK